MEHLSIQSSVAVDKKSQRCKLLKLCELHDKLPIVMDIDTGLYTIVTPSTSPHPTLLKCRYEGYLNYPGSMFCSNITSAVAKYTSRCALVQVKICSSGLACKIALSESLTYCFDPS
jgi:hypothetical protein